MTSTVPIGTTPRESAPRALYAAFDRFPTRKGAATHIARFAPALFERGRGGLLYVVGEEGMPLHQFEHGVEILRWEPEPGSNLLGSALGYAANLAALLDERGETFGLCQFRDPWGGVPILRHARRGATVYEVNALPSIELPVRHPALPARTLEKLRAQERYCLEHCDHVVVPAATIARLLRDLGVPDAKITLVPNGADLRARPPRPPDAPPRYLIYFGALQPWQGVDCLLHAFARLADLDDLHLVICASDQNRDARRLQDLAGRLELAPRLHWRYALEADELAAWLGHAAASLAPLADCARNAVQGCAPLKILESMAAGVPTLASDLPAVRELLRDGVDGRLVAPDRPAELARAIRLLLAYPEAAAEWGRNARERIASGFTWQHSLATLGQVYDRLAPALSRNVAAMR